MPKNTSKKRITIDDLAGMVQIGFKEVHEKMDKGFTDVYSKMNAGFDEVNQKFASVHEKMDKGFEESKQRDAFLQKQVDNLRGDVTDIKKVIKRLPTQKDFVSLKKRVYVLEQTIRT